MYKLCFLLFLISFLNVSAQDLKSGGKLKPEQAIMDIRNYTVSLDVDPDQQSINGFTEIDLVLSSPTDLLLFDLVHLLKVDKIWIDKKVASFEQKDDLIYVHSANSVGTGRHRIKIQYGG